MVAVFDSSPWIFLTKIGAIEQALSLFDTVIVPKLVKEEIAEMDDDAYSALRMFDESGSIRIVSAKSDRFVNALKRRLGKGESETIVIALDLEAEYAILDDRVARTISGQLGVGVKGTLGIVRRLMELKMFSVELTVLYEKLNKMGFRMKESIFWEIFNDLD